MFFSVFVLFSHFEFFEEEENFCHAIATPCSMHKQLNILPVQNYTVLHCSKVGYIYSMSDPAGYNLNRPFSIGCQANFLPLV